MIEFYSLPGWFGEMCSVISGRVPEPFSDFHDRIVPVFDAVPPEVLKTAASSADFQPYCLHRHFSRFYKR